MGQYSFFFQVLSGHKLGFTHDEILDIKNDRIADGSH